MRDEFAQASVMGSKCCTEFRFIKGKNATPWQPIPADRNIIPALHAARELLGDNLALDMRGHLED